jgi:hypothetical protein
MKNTQAINAQTIATSAAPAVREFDTDRTHTVGQYLNAHPDAKRVVVRNRREADKKFFTLGARVGHADYVVKL